MAPVGSAIGFDCVAVVVVSMMLGASPSNAAKTRYPVALATGLQLKTTGCVTIVSAFGDCRRGFLLSQFADAALVNVKCVDSVALQPVTNVTTHHSIFPSGGRMSLSVSSVSTIAVGAPSLWRTKTTYRFAP